jgi:hypothetical protein
MSHWWIPDRAEYSGRSGDAMDCPLKTVKAGVQRVPGRAKQPSFRMYGIRP